MFFGDDVFSTVREVCCFSPRRQRTKKKPVAKTPFRRLLRGLPRAPVHQRNGTSFIRENYARTSVDQRVRSFSRDVVRVPNVRAVTSYRHGSETLTATIFTAKKHVVRLGFDKNESSLRGEMFVSKHAESSKVLPPDQKR